MKIVLASPRGFCAGVIRAIQVVSEALQRFGPPVYVRHGIVHNKRVIEELASRGAIFVEDPAEAPPGSILIFSAHGVSPAVRSAADGLHHRSIDATCPLVAKVHVEARHFANDDYDILLIGHAGHVEVEGTLGEAPNHIRLIEDVEDARTVRVRDASRVALLTQTTLSVDDTREIAEILTERFPRIKAPRKGDICYATQNRQDAVKELARIAERILVISDAESSNGIRLVETARRAGVTALRVEHAGELTSDWIASARVIGVTAGASVSEQVVQGVVDRIVELAWPERVEAESMPIVEESVRFEIPRVLRDLPIRPIR
jgi:(E)-4-hydroxy-3-methyl-but-2-enyl pyrophosphate reductase (IPP and DMAPP forming)